MKYVSSDRTLHKYISFSQLSAKSVSPLCAQIHCDVELKEEGVECASKVANGEISFAIALALCVIEKEGKRYVYYREGGGSVSQSHTQEREREESCSTCSATQAPPEDSRAARNWAQCWNSCSFCTDNKY